MFSLRKEGLHLKYMRERDLKTVYFANGKLDVSSDIEKAYNPFCNQSDYHIVLPDTTTTLFTIYSSSFPTLSLDSNIASNAHIKSNFLRRGNACLNLGTKAVSPVMRQKTERYYDILANYSKARKFFRPSYLQPF